MKELVLLDNFALSWDLGAITFLFIATFLYGFSAGHKKIGSLLVSVYFASVLINIPFIDKVYGLTPQAAESFLKTGIFLLIVFILFPMFAGSVIGSTLGLPKKEEGQWWHLGFLSIVTAGFLSAAIFAVWPVSYYNNLSAVTKIFFADSFAHFAWALAGIIALAALRRTKKR